MVMLQGYLREGPSVTNRLLAGGQGPSKRSVEARTQTMLDQWEAQYGMHTKTGGGSGWSADSTA